MKNIQKERTINQQNLIFGVTERLLKKKTLETAQLELCYAPVVSINLSVDTVPTQETIRLLESSLSESEIFKKYFSEDFDLKIEFFPENYLLVLHIILPYENEEFDLEQYRGIKEDDFED